MVHPVPGTIAVLTMTRAHHDHLLGQVDGLSVGTAPPHLHVVISMGDRDLTRGRLPLGTDRWRTIVKPVQTDRRALPYAAARNLAASLAVDEGADVLIFLDAAVIPGPRTLERYAEVVTQGAGEETPTAPVIWTGAVLDLPPLENPAVGYSLRRLHELARRAPGAPALSPGQIRVEPRWHLFSPASFAMSAADFAATGGFVEDYAGRGLEAADFATAVARAYVSTLLRNFQEYVAIVGDPGHDMPELVLARHAFTATPHQRLFDRLERRLRRAVAGFRPILGKAAFAARPTRLGGALAGRARAHLRQRFLGKHAVAAKNTFAAAGNPRDRHGRREIFGDTLALLFRRRVLQPHQEKERHHGGHEVGIGDLPGAPMMPVAAGDLLSLDDDWRDIAVCAHIHHLLHSPEERVTSRGLPTA